MSGKGAERDILRLPIFNHITKSCLRVYALCSAYEIVQIQYLSICCVMLFQVICFHNSSLFVNLHTDPLQWFAKFLTFQKVWWWDPISPIHIMNHVQHFCDNLGRFMLKDDKGRQKGDALRPFTMSYTILQYSTVLPFTSATFSNLFWHF